MTGLAGRGGQYKVYVFNSMSNLKDLYLQTIIFLLIRLLVSTERDILLAQLNFILHIKFLTAFFYFN